MVVAANMSDAILKSQMIRPDLLVIDAGFPGAWTLLKKITDYKFFKGMPILLLSERELTPEELDAAMQAGVAGCLTGPGRCKGAQRTSQDGEAAPALM